MRNPRGEQELAKTGGQIRAVRLWRTFGQAEMQTQRHRWVELSPGGHSGFGAGAIHQQAGAVQSAATDQLENSLVHSFSQAEIIGMESRRSRLAAAAGRELRCAAPDQGIQQCWCEHQGEVAPQIGRGSRQHQRHQAADDQVDAVLHHQPAPGEALSAGFFTEGQQRMAQVTRQRSDQKGQGIGQPFRCPSGQPEQHAVVHPCGRKAHNAVTAQTAQQLGQGHGVAGALSRRFNRASTKAQADCS